MSINRSTVVVGAMSVLAFASLVGLTSGEAATAEPFVGFGVEKGAEPTARTGVVAPSTGSADFPAHPSPARPVLEGSWTGPDGAEYPAVCQFGVDVLESDYGFTAQQAIDAREQCHLAAVTEEVVARVEAVVPATKPAPQAPAPVVDVETTPKPEVAPAAPKGCGFADPSVPGGWVATDCTGTGERPFDENNVQPQHPDETVWCQEADQYEVGHVCNLNPDEQSAA